MIELILIRHAKSDWHDPNASDHDRTLNARGKRDAPVMANNLANAGVAVGRLLSSTAARASSTAEVFGAALGVSAELDPDLYLSSAATLLSKAAATGATSVALVAHDPGISVLAAHLSGDGIHQMPTCAVARFTWRTESWDEAVTRVADDWALETPRET
ncbi:SixA phosphatase family protein [Lysinibacter cavernae]|uniref:Phosphohistidine phosphatase n=1 Tax=Lysinibacter cavernae TaxID=1640652 RepID=A0A7X5QYB6_9MICO|nr:histidine phosphatase family protein [Lysinibacter cavernae]NIH52144.1 phosphohistidine phosphatase [Lysinibacter cavernae]